MRRRNLGWHFDLSTTLILGLATLLFISLPGGCGDDTEPVEEGTGTEVSAEPTSPEMMEIVEPEPADNEPVDSDEEEGGEPENQNEEASDPGEGEEQPEEEQQVDDGTYAVQPGDTLYDIAVELEVSVDALIEANDISDPQSLQVGDVLQVPE